MQILTKFLEFICEEIYRILEHFSKQQDA